MPQYPDTKQEPRDIYLAGPLFTDGERHYLEQIDRMCLAQSLTTYLPHRDAGFGGCNTAAQYFAHDLEMLRACPRVIAVLTGSDVDAGTAWEIGYAYANGKAIVGIREDLRQSEISLMVTESIRVVTSHEELDAILQHWMLEKSP